MTIAQYCRGSRNVRAALATPALVTFLTAAVSPNPAAALVNPSYQYGYFDDVSHYGPGGFSGPGYSVTLSPLPFLNLDSSWNSANVSVGLSDEQQWRAVMVYQVKVAGPAGPAVPLDVTYSISASTTVTGGAYALAQPSFIYDDNPGFTPVALTVGGYSDGSQTSGGTLHFSVAANTPFEAGLAATETLYDLGGTASVSIDPMYTIDPSFAATDPNYLTDYTLQFSPTIQNIGQTTSIPEPASLSLLACGLVGLWGRTRNRRASPLATG